MKKLIAICLAMLMCLSIFAACGTKDPAGTEAPGTTEAPTPQESESKPSESESEDVETPTSDLELAKENIKALYSNLLKSNKTGSDFTVVPQVMIAGVAYQVTWTVNTEEVAIVVTEEDGNKTITVDVNEDAYEDLEYVLTATISDASGNSTTLEFNLLVPMFKVNTFAEYAAAEDDSLVAVKGIITGVFSKTTGSKANGLYIQDENEDGGYYVYNLTDDPNGVLLPGMTVVVRGKKDLYNGTHEIIEASVTVVDETIKAVTPVDFTDIIANAEMLNDADLVYKQALLVTIKGATILEVGDNGYYYFQAGNHKTYVRISSSNNATSTEALETIKSVHAANYGNLADVTGVISIYNGNFYLSPVSADAFSNISVPTRTDAEKVELELSGLNLDSSVSSDKVIDLPSAGTTYDDVTFVWTTDDTTGAATIADGKLTIVVPDSEVTVKVTVTVTCGEVTETKEFSIKLSKTITSIKDAIEIGAAKDHNTYTTEKYIVAGIIKEVYNAQYGNMYIVDELGNTFTVYGTYGADGADRYDALENKPVAGDYVVILGALGQYNGTPQMKNGWIQSFTTPITITEAMEIGAAKDHNTYTTEKYIVAGTIKDVYNTQYGNMHIVDELGNEFTVYGTYGANGTDRYDAMASKPVAGDYVVILGVLGQYNGTPQMKNGWIQTFTAAEGGEAGSEEETESPAVEVAGKTYTFAEYEAGTQYAENETHKLDDHVTVVTDGAHFTTQIRLYDSAPNDYNPNGLDGTAVFVTTSAVKSFALNAGNKDAELQVYGSTDGETWTLITTLTVTAAYADFTVDLGDSSYTYIKLDAVGAQIRVASVTIELD